MIKILGFGTDLKSLARKTIENIYSYDKELSSYLLKSNINPQLNSDLRFRLLNFGLSEEYSEEVPKIPKNMHIKNFDSRNQLYIICNLTEEIQDAGIDEEEMKETEHIEKCPKRREIRETIPGLSEELIEENPEGITLAKEIYEILGSEKTFEEFVDSKQALIGDSVRGTYYLETRISKPFNPDDSRYWALIRYCSANKLRDDYQKINEKLDGELDTEEFLKLSLDQ